MTPHLEKDFATIDPKPLGFYQANIRFPFLGTLTVSIISGLECIYQPGFAYGISHDWPVSIFSVMAILPCSPKHHDGITEE